MIDIDLSLAIDGSGNIFIHNRDALFQFEKTPHGYGLANSLQDGWIF
jgi:hypothetical protein